MLVKIAWLKLIFIDRSAICVEHSMSKHVHNCLILNPVYNISCRSIFFTFITICKLVLLRAERAYGGRSANNNK